MKKKDLEKLKGRTVAELTADVKTAKEKLWQLGKDLTAGKQKNGHALRATRVEIARMLTLINQKNK